MRTSNSAVAEEDSGNKIQSARAALAPITKPMPSARIQRRRRACRKVFASMPPRSTFWADGSGEPVMAKGWFVGAVRLNHEGVAGVMRLADQSVVWLWRLRRIVAMHKSLVCSWLRPGRSRGRKVAVVRNRQLDPEPQLMSQLRRGRLKRPKTAIFQNFAGGQRAYPMPAQMSFLNACCHFSTTFERSSQRVGMDAVRMPPTGRSCTVSTGMVTRSRICNSSHSSAKASGIMMT